MVSPEIDQFPYLIFESIDLKKKIDFRFFKSISEQLEKEIENVKEKMNKSKQKE